MAAAIAAATAYWFGPVVVFWLMAVLALGSIAATLAIPANAIDNHAARGLEIGAGHDHDSPSGLSVLLSSRPLLVFAACATLFHFSNAAMLPLVGQKLALLNKEVGTSLMAICIVAAQAVMVPVAMVVGMRADVWGRSRSSSAGFAIWPCAGCCTRSRTIRTGWSASSSSMASGPASRRLVSGDCQRHHPRNGRFNVSLGAVATAQGLGASLSAAVAGVIVVAAGYSVAFWALAAIASIGFVVYWTGMPETASARASAAPSNMKASVT